MKPAFRFYIDNIELVNDIYNFDDITFNLVRSDKYYSYSNVAPLKTLELIKEDKDRLNNIWRNGNLNTDVVFRIDIINREVDIYSTFQESVIDWTKRNIKTDENNVSILSIGLNASHEQGKLNARDSNELPIININKSIEDENINPFDFQKVKVNRKVLKQGGDWYLFDDGMPPETNFGIGDPEWFDLFKGMGTGVICPSFYSFQLKGELYPKNFHSTYSNDLDCVQNITEGNFLISPSYLNRSLQIHLDITLNMILGTHTTTNNSIVTYLVSYEYDKANDVFVNRTELDFNDSLIVAGGGISFDCNITFNTTFNYKKNKYYTFEYQLNPTTDIVTISARVKPDTINELWIRYNDDDTEFKTTTHNGLMVHECFDSLLQQICDKPSIFESAYFGRTDLGYPQDGEGSLLMITNGLLLRNAVNSDDTDINLHLTFEKLFQTMSVQWGLKLYFDFSDRKFHIEKRLPSTATPIHLDWKTLTSSLLNKLLYTEVKVGNERVKYENVNGTNEPNTILHFTTQLRAKKNTLNLVAKYNDDSLGIELARRLSFSTSATVDSKYDDKVFCIIVKRDGSDWETVQGFDGFDIIQGVILPQYLGNIQMTPRRKLINNADLIGTSYFKFLDDLLFKKADNLATLESREIGKALIVEQSDLLESEMVKNFAPIKHVLEIGHKNLIFALNNPNQVYTFYNEDGELKEGEIIDVKIKNNEGTITLIEKI